MIGNDHVFIVVIAVIDLLLYMSACLRDRTQTGNRYGSVTVQWWGGDGLTGLASSEQRQAIPYHSDRATMMCAVVGLGKAAALRALVS